MTMTTKQKPITKREAYENTLVLHIIKILSNGAMKFVKTQRHLPIIRPSDPGAAEKAPAGPALDGQAGVFDAIAMAASRSRHQYGPRQPIACRAARNPLQKL